MEIMPLSMVPQHCPLLARWAHDEWYRDRAIDYDTVLGVYRARAMDDSLPWMAVALEGVVPAGMVTLKEDDLWSRRDLNPWLSGLFVAPSFRRRGIGHALSMRVIDRVIEFGYEELYLFLARANRAGLERYYSARGWEACGRAVDNDGFDTVVMRFDTMREAPGGAVRSSGTARP